MEVPEQNKHEQPYNLKHENYCPNGGKRFPTETTHVNCTKTIDSSGRKAYSASLGE